MTDWICVFSRRLSIHRAIDFSYGLNDDFEDVFGKAQMENLQKKRNYLGSLI